MQKRYLVTGGSGFIGSALVRRLASDGFAVRVLDNGSRGPLARLSALAGRVEIMAGDIRDPQVVSRAAAGIDGIFHLAYVNGTEFFYSKPAEVLEIAVKGMINVLDACRAHGIRELILASSSEVYQTPPKVPTDETVPLVVPDVTNPRYSYGGGKIISELLALNYGRTDFDRVLIFRPHNVYGPDMGFEHVIPQFCRRMADACRTDAGDEPVPFPIQGTGQETRSFIHIDDFVDGVMLMCNKGEHQGIYHIGTENEVPIAEVARLVAAAFGRTIELRPGAAAPGGTPRRCPSIARMRALGFAPRVPLEDGIHQTARWYAANLP